MEHDDMISLEQGYTVEQLIDMYNDAVELIWALREKLQETKDDLELFEQAYEEVSNKLYG
jgi:hypothetical protein